MRKLILLGALFLGGVAVADLNQINCVKSVTPGAGLTGGGNGPNISISIAETNPQVTTLVSSVTAKGNFGIQGALTTPLTATSSATFSGNVQVGGYHQIFSRTAAQIRAITPTAVGQQYYCSDCTAIRTCISTGTAIGAFSSPVAATTICN